MDHRSGILDDTSVTWKDAFISLGIAIGVGTAAVIGFTYYFHQELGHMTGSSFGTVGQIASKVFL